MFTLLIVLAVLYSFATILVAAASGIDFQIQREFARTTTSEKLRVESEAEARVAARRFFRAPLWPLMILDAIVKMRAAARIPEDER